MLKLIIETDAFGGLSFNPPVPFLSNAAQTEWENLVSKFLSNVFADKTFWIVAEKAKASQWRYLDKNLYECEITAKNEDYLCAFAQQLSVKDFRQIIGTSDFYWDGIFFFPSVSNNTEHLSQILANSVDFEFISSFNDGCGITWNLPHLPINVITDLLEKLSR